MTEARLRDSSPQASKTQETSRFEFPKKPGPDEIARLLNLREIEQEYGLSDYHVYRAVHEGRLHAVQVNGRGRIYYAEWEVRAFLSQLFEMATAAAA